MTDKEQNQHPAERQPLFNKLDHRTVSSPWHNEGLEYSKTGRRIVDMLIEAARNLFS